MNTVIKDALARAGYTVLATGGSLLLADGAAHGLTGISVADYKAAGVAALAGLLSLAKTGALNYLNTHKSLKSQVTELQQQLAALKTVA